MGMQHAVPPVRKPAPSGAAAAISLSNLESCIPPKAWRPYVIIVQFSPDMITIQPELFMLGYI
eukprot:scaffold180558_cov33-Prasinocladus_malaysianus.AAC.2